MAILKLLVFSRIILFLLCYHHSMLLLFFISTRVVGYPFLSLPLFHPLTSFLVDCFCSLLRTVRLMIIHSTARTIVKQLVDQCSKHELYYYVYRKAVVVVVEVVEKYSMHAQIAWFLIIFVCGVDPPLKFSFFPDRHK